MVGSPSLLAAFCAFSASLRAFRSSGVSRAMLRVQRHLHREQWPAELGAMAVAH